MNISLHQSKYFFAAFAVLFFARPALAQEVNPSMGIAISPPTFELTSNPGDTLRNTLRVENINDYDIKLTIEKRNFTAIGEEGAVGLTEDDTTYSLKSWIQIDTPELTIPKKSSRSIPYIINVPDNAEPGGHFGSIVARTVTGESLTSSGANLAQELGALILLRVSGTVKESANILSFRPSQEYYEKGPVDLELRLENQGSVHLKPVGTIVITNVFNQEVAVVPLNTKNILPGAVRLITTTWEPKFGFGPYTATLVASYSNNPQTLTSTTTIQIYPYRLIIAGTLFLIFIIYLLTKSQKRLKLAFKVLLSGKA